MFGARLGGGAAVGEEAGDVLALTRERPKDFLRVGGQLGELLALRGEDAEQRVDVAQYRVGPLDQHLEVFAAAGQPGAEFVEDQAEALRVGQLLDVVDQVRIDAGAVVLERQQVLTGAGLPVGDLPQRWRGRGARSAGHGRAAIDELLADQRLRSDQAAGVAAEVLEAGVFDLHRDHRFAGHSLRLAVFVAVDFTGQRYAHRFDFADRRSSDPHFLALDHEATAVEDRADDIAAAAAAAAGEQQDHDGDCGRIRQLASRRKSWKPGSVIFIAMKALPGTACHSPSS